MKKRIEIRDWYQNPETEPACILLVEDGADLTPSQVRKVKHHCPNWTKDIEQYAQDRDGTIRCRVARESDD